MKQCFPSLPPLSLFPFSLSLYLSLSLSLSLLFFLLYSHFFQKFAENFDPKKTGIRFPVVIANTRNCIAETFEKGDYINRLVQDEDHHVRYQ